MIHTATLDQADALARLINLAYRVEDFFVDGDRTNPDEVRAMIASGAFLVIEEPDAPMAGCVHVKISGDRGFFAMLSVDPSQQRRGIGARLIAAAEDHCRAAGCRYLDLHVFNVRTELPPFYRRLGFVETGTEPCPDDVKSRIPCHVICMSKPLVGVLESDGLTA